MASHIAGMWWPSPFWAFDYVWYHGPLLVSLQGSGMMQHNIKNWSKENQEDISNFSTRKHSRNGKWILSCMPNPMDWSQLPEELWWEEFCQHPGTEQGNCGVWIVTRAPWTEWQTLHVLLSSFLCMYWMLLMFLKTEKWCSETYSPKYKSPQLPHLYLYIRNSPCHCHRCDSQTNNTINAVQILFGEATVD